MCGAWPSSHPSTGSGLLRREHGWKVPRASTTRSRRERRTPEGARRFLATALSGFVGRVEPSLQHKQRFPGAGGNRSRATHAGFGPGDTQGVFHSHDSVSGHHGRRSTPSNAQTAPAGPSQGLPSREVGLRAAEKPAFPFPSGIAACSQLVYSSLSANHHRLTDHSLDIPHACANRCAMYL